MENDFSNKNDEATQQTIITCYIKIKAGTISANPIFLQTPVHPSQTTGTNTQHKRCQLAHWPPLPAFSLQGNECECAPVCPISRFKAGRGLHLGRLYQAHL